MQWGLPKGTLKDVWAAVAGDQGYLSQQQFVQCLYLMDNAKRVSLTAFPAAGVLVESVHVASLTTMINQSVNPSVKKQPVYFLLSWDSSGMKRGLTIQHQNLWW